MLSKALADHMKRLTLASRITPDRHAKQDRSRFAGHPDGFCAKLF
jgi:hypothetical protein